MELYILSHDGLRMLQCSINQNVSLVRYNVNMQVGNCALQQEGAQR